MTKNKIYYKKLDKKKRKYFTKNDIINLLTICPGTDYFIRNNPIVSAKINISKKIFAKGKLKDGTVITLEIRKYK